MGWKIEIEREFWDSGIAKKVGGAYAGVYLALRAYQRNKPRDDRERGWIKEGVLFATVSKAKLAKAAGVGRTSIYEAVEKLSEKGWIRVEGTRGKDTIFVLGEAGRFFIADQTVRDPNTPTSEVVRDPNTPTPGIVRDPDRNRPGSGQESSGIRTGIVRDPGTLKILVEDPGEDPNKTPIRSVGVRPIRRVQRDPSPSRGIRVQTPTPKAPPPSNGEVRPERPPGSTELVELWVDRYRKTFDVEDLSLRTKAAKTRAARLVTRRVVDWLEGDWGRMRLYLGQVLGWWGRRLEEKADFPSGLPTLAKILEQKPNGEVSHFFDRWRNGRMRDEVRGEVRR